MNMKEAYEILGLTSKKERYEGTPYLKIVGTGGPWGGEFTYEVIVARRRTAPLIWHFGTTSAMTGGYREYGDGYVAQIKDHAQVHLEEVDGETPTPEQLHAFMFILDSKECSDPMKDFSW